MSDKVKIIFPQHERMSLYSQKTKRRTRPELSEDQKQEIKEAFELFDADKDNALDYHELKVWDSNTGRYESTWIRCQETRSTQDSS
jgi:hypothetical protein